MRLPQSKSTEQSCSGPPPPPVEECLADAPFFEHMDPVLMEGWRDFADIARKQQQEIQQRLCDGLATEQRSAAWAGVLAGMLIIGGAVVAIFVPLSERLFSSLSEAAASLLSRYGVMLIGIVAGALVLACRASSKRRIRDYENTLAFMSEMHVMVSAAVAMNRGSAIDRSIDALAAAQRDGVLSPASAVYATGNRRKLATLAKLGSLFVK